MILQKMSVSLDFSKLKDRRKEEKKKKERESECIMYLMNLMPTDLKIKYELGSRGPTKIN